MSIYIHTKSEDETSALAAAIAPFILAGDLVTLQGDLGTGKTVFARALIRSLVGDPELEVASPTFSLVHHYQASTFPVAHADFYRLEEPGSSAELGLEDHLDDGVVIVEWPQNGHLDDEPDLAVTIDEEGPAGRRFLLGASQRAAARLVRSLHLRAVLEQQGWGKAKRHALQGDASTRRYERLEQSDGRDAILMDALRQPDGPIIKDGKPYSQLAHLAEDVTAFVGVANWLRHQKLAAPAILSSELDAGFLILENLGTETIRQGSDGAPVLERYMTAIECLARLHMISPPTTLPVDEKLHVLHPFDWPVHEIELSLFADWFAPHALGKALSNDEREAFFGAWKEVLSPFLYSAPVIVLRDYHSPNLIWRPQEQGLAKVGIIDIQDALLGHPAYDVGSLAQDARVAVPLDMESQLLDHYCGLRAHEEAFDEEDFRRAYPVFAAQRLTKVLGIFVRLKVRDHKGHYLAHIPHLLDYLERDLRAPSLAPVAAWHEKTLPLDTMKSLFNSPPDPLP